MIIKRGNRPRAERNGADSIPPDFVRQSPALTVIVPVRNEAGNVRRLVKRLAHIDSAREMEILFVDDSDDGTGDVVREVSRESAVPVRLIERKGAERRGGLGGAVVEGLRASMASWACVIDGDLQHPPEMIDQMIARARESGADIVIASRHQPDGANDGLNSLRRLLSGGSALIAKALFPLRLRHVTDPMSGFFLVRREAIDLDALRPKGFKILLEILGRGSALKIAEVPFRFGKRLEGESKAGVREAARYLRQVTGLRLSSAGSPFGKFAFVGLSGLAVNTALLAAFTELGGVHYLLSAILATQGSTAWNFALTELWVFRARSHTRPAATRLLAFYAMNNLALWIRGPMLVALTAGLGINYIVSNVLTLGGLTLARFALADTWIWRTKRARATGWRYNIHGVISVESDAWLPELERFIVPQLEGPATIAITTSRVVVEGEHARRIVYDEGLGRLGFGASIELGDRIDITVTPLVARSPHVLYTNVVEPVLRWTFVERGHALVHGACVAVGDDAYLITARTDTGKTTTMLKLLDHLPWAFMSDDLTLVKPDGRVLMYPKPMTISRHTVHAVKTPLLTGWERFTLFFQSRLHSRSGRKFAMFLIRSHLPVATINTLVQFLVPPPKYHVERLIPNVRLAEDARLRGMAIIQRGDDVEQVLEPADALRILLENCEDAYGFPPYHTIEHFLHSSNGRDLREKEREIIASALESAPTTLIGSTGMNWAERIPHVIGYGSNGSSEVAAAAAHLEGAHATHVAAEGVAD